MVLGRHPQQSRKQQRTTIAEEGRHRHHYPDRRVDVGGGNNPLPGSTQLLSS